MNDKSYERVPSILRAATSTFSTAEEKRSVQAFHDKIIEEKTLADLNSTFESIYVQIDKERISKF